jgi:sporadic carbohydrate cluster protein (TIGR04323 family)
MNFRKKIYQGYIKLQSFNSIYLPPAIQNLIIKNYCEQNNFIFKLSVNEQNIKNCHMELFSILRNIKKIDGMIMNSIYMLPQDIKDFNLFCRLYSKRNIEIIFIFENEKVNSLKDLKKKYQEYQKYKSFNDFLSN